MKRILITIILSLGIAYIQAQDKPLMPTATGKYKDANHPTNVLLKKTANFVIISLAHLMNSTSKG